MAKAHLPGDARPNSDAEAHGYCRRWAWAYAVVLVGLLATTVRAWRIQVGVPADVLSSLDRYLTDALGMWLEGSLFLLFAGLLLSMVSVATRLSRLERLGWAWASWAIYVACVLPRPGNFWANGAHDDLLIVYAPGALVALATVWLVVRPRVRLPIAPLWPGLTAVSVAGIVLFRVHGGHGMEDAVQASTWTALAASVAGLVSYGRRSGQLSWRLGRR